MEATIDIAPAPPPAPKLYGLLIQFDSASEVLHGAEQVRDAGFRRWDVYTPFPVHGMDDAMGVKPTVLPFLVLGGGLTGLVVAVGLQWYCNNFVGIDNGTLSGYPNVFSGKPYFGLPANIPICFELTVLFSALTTFFALWALIQLPRLHHPVFNSKFFRRVTDDKFFIAIEAKDPQFDYQKTSDLAHSLGGSAVEEIKD